jgi:flavin-dependent dehydrogenase
MNKSQRFRHDRYDAVVIGARCAGSATAMLLARAGARVLLVDRQEHGSDTLSTHAMMRGGVIQLSRWGLLPEVIRAGTPRVSVTTFRYGDEAIAVPIRADALVDGLYAPRRMVLDPILADAARRAGAEVRHGVVMLDVTRDTSGGVDGVILRTEDGTVHVIGAGVVVGADGIGSTVARRSGAATLVRGRASTATIYGYVPNPGVAGYEWTYGPRSGIAAIPTNGGELLIGVSVPTPVFDAELRTDIPAAFMGVLRELDPALADHVASVGRPALHTFRGREGFLRQPYGAGWVLAGDAGFFRDPITAHGMTDALRDAEGAALAIIDGSPQGFAAYQRERDELAGRFLEVTDDVAAFDQPLPVVQAMHKRYSEVMKAEVSALAARRDWEDVVRSRADRSLELEIAS